MSFLNSLKANISNITQAIAESITDPEERFEDDPPSINPQDAVVESLKVLCVDQNEQISMLHKEIFEYKQSKIRETSGSSKTLVGSDSHAPLPQIANTDDSWFWNDEASSSSSKKDDNDNGSPDSVGVDLTTIPLENDFQAVEKLRRELIDRDAKIKSYSMENSLLGNKLKNLASENLELNRNIDELDKQHNLAVENVLEAKNALQAKLAEINKDFLEYQRKVEEEKKANKIEVQEQLRSLQDDQVELESLRNEVRSLTEDLEVIQEEKEKMEVANRKIAEKYRKEDQNASKLTEDALKQQVLELSNQLLKIQAEKDQMQLISTAIADKYKIDRENHQTIEHNFQEIQLKLQDEITEIRKNLQTAQAEKLNLTAALQSSQVIQSETDAQQTPTSEIEEIIYQMNSLINNYYALDENHENFSNISHFVEYFKNWISAESSKLKELESENCNLLEENITVNEKLTKITHDKEILKADLINYEIECSELMKNNSILLADLENYKSSGKLETIQEGDGEENIGILEQQLERSNSLNQSLEDEFDTMKKTIKNLELEKLNLEQKIKVLQEKIQGTESSDEELKVKAKLQKEIESRDQMLNEKDKELRIAFEELDKMAHLKQQFEFVSSNSNQLMQQNGELQREMMQFSVTNSNLTAQINQLTNASLEKGDQSQLEEELRAIQEMLGKVTLEKETLVGLVTIKHDENVQYHKEILRLNQLISVQQTELTNLKEKLELQENNLKLEQTALKLLQQDKHEALEQNSVLNKNIERLRQHLLEVADAYTLETVDLQKTIEEYKIKLISLEEDTKKSTTAYTSASIRSNQQTETLTLQYSMLVQQRDDLNEKLSAAEDRESRNQAALVNLQCALEVFQKDKERDIELQTEKIRQEMELERKKQTQLANEILSLQSQLQDAKNGLSAASRLTNKLEMGQSTIEKLQNSIVEYQQKIDSLNLKLQEKEKSNETAIDADLIKNLVLGYLTAPNLTAKTQILKLIATVLKLSDQECEKLGIRDAKNPGSQNSGGKSLAEAFVHFLEKESQPRLDGNLLNIHKKEEVAVSSSPAGQVTLAPLQAQETPTIPQTPQIPQVIPVQPILINENNFLSFPPQRNSSTILKDILNDR